MSDDGLEADWLEEAGFSATPPGYKFDPALDVTSLQARLSELSCLQHAPFAKEESTTNLAQPFCEEDLLRAYGDGPCDGTTVALPETINQRPFGAVLAVVIDVDRVPHAVLHRIPQLPGRRHCFHAGGTNSD